MGGTGQRGQRPRPQDLRGALAARAPRADPCAVALAGAGAGLAASAACRSRPDGRTGGRARIIPARGHRRRHARGDRGGRGARPADHRPRRVCRLHATAHPRAGNRRRAHDRGTAEHSAAGRRARARALRPQHLQRRAAPLARAERRLVPLRLRALRAVHARRTSLRGELLTAASTRAPRARRRRRS